MTAPTAIRSHSNTKLMFQRIGVEALSSDLARHQPRAAFRYVAAPSNSRIEWVKANPELSSSQEVELYGCDLTAVNFVHQSRFPHESRRSVS